MASWVDTHAHTHTLVELKWFQETRRCGWRVPGLKMLSEFSDRVNLQNFLGGACPRPPRFGMLCMLAYVLCIIILDLNHTTSENVPMPLVALEYFMLISWKLQLNCYITLKFAFTVHYLWWQQIYNNCFQLAQWFKTKKRRRQTCQRNP